jgi:hypothetical protein
LSTYAWSSRRRSSGISGPPGSGRG